MCQAARQSKWVCACVTVCCSPWYQGSWGQHGAHLGPTGPRWAPCWPQELCYLGLFGESSSCSSCTVWLLPCVNICAIVIICLTRLQILISVVGNANHGAWNLIIALVKSLSYHEHLIKMYFILQVSRCQLWVPNYSFHVSVVVIIGAIWGR